MFLDEVSKTVGDVPYMQLPEGRTLSEFITKHRLRNILELGFYHGVSTCYLAATVKNNGGGSVVTIDLENVRGLKPSITELLGRCGVADAVTTHFEPTSYVWRLMRFLEQDPIPQFDMCFIDGAHNWFVDGFAFYLVDRLLKPGGWIVFSDLDWTYDASPTNREAARAKGMPEDERTTPQVRKVYELLVKPHPSYGEFMEKDDWAYARKVADASVGKPAVKREIVYVSGSKTGMLGSLARRILGR